MSSTICPFSIHVNITLFTWRQTSPSRVDSIYDWVTQLLTISVSSNFWFFTSSVSMLLIWSISLYCNYCTSNCYATTRDICPAHNSVDLLNYLLIWVTFFTQCNTYSTMTTRVYFFDLLLLSCCIWTVTCYYYNSLYDIYLCNLSEVYYTVN